MMMTTKTMTHTLLSNDDKSISSADGQPSKLAFLCPSLLITRYHHWLNVVLLKNSSAHHNNNNNEIIIMAFFDPPHNYNPLPSLLLLCVLSLLLMFLLFTPPYFKSIYVLCRYPPSSVLLLSATNTHD